MYNGKEKPPELGTRRAYGFGLLYGGGKTRIALADYRQPRPVLGNYPLRLLDFTLHMNQDTTEELFREV